MDEPLRLVAGSQPVAPLAETASFEVFVDRQPGSAVRVPLLMTGSRHEAEEIAQEAYVRVLDELGPRAASLRSDRLPSPR